MKLIKLEADVVTTNGFNDRLDKGHMYVSRVCVCV